MIWFYFFFFSSRRRHTRLVSDWSSDVCSSDLSWANRPRRYAMTTHKLISADSHIVEPPDLYTHRIEPKYRERAPRMERMETPTGRKYDAWFIEGQQVGSLGAVMQAGQRFEDPSQIDFLGTGEDVRLGAYDPQAMIKENEMDGVW